MEESVLSTEGDRNQCDTSSPFLSFVLDNERSDEGHVFTDSMTSHKTTVDSSFLPDEFLKPNQVQQLIQDTSIP